jgi:hypothetical protein
MSMSIIVRVHDEEADAEELGELFSDLRQTMLGTEIVGCSAEALPSPGRSGNPMERAADPALFDAMLVVLASTNALKAVCTVISTWARVHNCSVKAAWSNGKMTVEFTGRADDMQKAEGLVAAVGRPTTPPR